MKIKTRWLAAAAALILAVSGAAAWAILTRSEPGQTAKIYVDGELTRTVDLADVGEAYEFDVSSDRGTNRVRVEKGRVRVVSADCPDKTCVEMGWRSDGAVPIACLPHHLVIRIESDGAPDAQVSP